MTIDGKTAAEWLETCKPLANSPSILDRLENELRKQGFAGSANIPKLVYLTATSRLFTTPVNLVAMGPSGAGKTYAIESGLQFIPTGEIENLSGMSEKALVYGGDLDLKHRVLYLGEAAGMANGNGRTFLRQLLTEGKLNYRTVQKTSEGMKGENLPTIEGPLAFMMATTDFQLHHEDQTRMLVVNLTEDPERIREALRNQARGRSKGKVAIDTGPWHALQEWVKQSRPEVYLPFGEKLADMVPIGHFRVQRDFPKALTLVETHAVLHQQTRGRDEDGRIIATRADYEEVYPLIKAPLEHGLEEAVPDSVREVVEGVRDLTTGKNAGNAYEGVSQSKVAGHIGRHPSIVSRNATLAAQAGYLENKSPGKGRVARLVLGDRELPSGSVLPTPEELFEAPKQALWPNTPVARHAAAAQAADEPRQAARGKQLLPW